MNPQLMRKYLDMLTEQSQPPSQEFINQLDQAATKGTFDKSQFDASSADQQAMLLRNVGNYKDTNPNYNPSAQGAEARAATIQNMKDTGKITADQASQNAGSGEFFKPTATDTKAKPKPAPAQPAPVAQQGPRTTIEPEVAARVPLSDKNGLYGGLAYDYAGGSAPGNPKAQVGYQGDSGARMSIARSLDPNMPGSTEFRGSMPLTDKLAGTAVYKRDDRGASQAQVGAEYNISPTAKVSANYQQNVGGGSADPRFTITAQKDF
jgi:hypothetical protein